MPIFEPCPGLRIGWDSFGLMDSQFDCSFGQRLKLSMLLSGGVGTSFFGEFDPGSGRTLAACLTHASRTMNRVLAPGD